METTTETELSEVLSSPCNAMSSELSSGSAQYGGGKSLADLIYEKKKLEITESDGLLSSFKGRVEEAAVEETVVEMIIRGEWTALKPNSGQSVNMGDHYVCVYCEQQQDMGSLYKIWQWNGFVRVCGAGAVRRDYICGHYFEAVDDDDPVTFLDLA